MKLLLDMYKSAPKEQRDKVQLMAAERKSKAEVCSFGSCLSLSFFSVKPEGHVKCVCFVGPPRWMS